MKKGMLMIISVFSLLLSTGCVIEKEPEKEVIINEYEGIPLAINEDTVTSYSYTFTYFEEIDIKVMDGGKLKVVVGNRMVYALENPNGYYVITETIDNEYISIEEDEMGLFGLELSEFMTDFYEEYPLEDFVQKDISNTFEYQEEDTLVTLKVNEDMEIIDYRIFSNTDERNVFRVYDINNTEFTIPEFIITSKGEYVMNKYFEDYVHLFVNNEITITENDVDAIIDDRGNIEIITINTSYTIRDTDEIIIMDDNYNSYTKEEFLQLETSITESFFDQIIDIASKLEHFEDLLKTDE